MSQLQQLHEIQVDCNVSVPMRDGTLLSADIYRPKSAGKWPVIVSRDGYDPANAFTVDFGTFFSQRGYVYVINNTRGTYRSEGVFFPFIDDAWGENRDGYDAIEWAAHQPWSDGNVGMYGISYGCFTQYLQAPSRPPSLKACVPIFGTSSPVNFVFPCGIYHMQWHRGWAVDMAADMALNYPHGLNRTREDATTIVTRLGEVQQEIEKWFRYIPLKDFPPLQETSPWYFEHLNHPAGDPWWNQTNARVDYREIDVPMLQIAGWYEENLNAMIDTYTGLVAQGRSSTCRNGQRLIIGPWLHADTTVLPLPLDFTDRAHIDFKETALRWFDYWLKGQENGIPDEPAVRAFLMGENRWLELDQWPPANVTYTPIYLREGTGKSEHSLNGGHLTWEAPSDHEHTDSYAYDPDDPIPGHVISSSSPEVLRQDREGRMLTYTSEILRDAVTVVGPVKATLYASSSTPDTDWFVCLCDVLPDGTVVRVCGGMMKARYRNSIQHEELMEPGHIYQFEIEMTATAQTFAAGHRIRLHVTSSEFPSFDRNLNTGGTFGEEAAAQVAINTIFHDAKRASYLLLPIMESK